MLRMKRKKSTLERKIQCMKGNSPQKKEKYSLHREGFTEEKEKYAQEEKFAA
jgi:hypothetical protein